MLYVRPGQQKLLDQLLPQQGVRHKTQGLFFKAGEVKACSHIPGTGLKAIIS